MVAKDGQIDSQLHEDLVQSHHERSSMKIVCRHNCHPLER